MRNFGCWKIVITNRVCYNIVIWIGIAIVFVLFTSISTVDGSWHWSSDSEICGDKICGEQTEYKNQQTKIPDWVENIFKWYEEDKISGVEIQNAINYLIAKKSITVNPLPKMECSGDARCISGIVTQVIDGDTIKVYGKSIRFALSSAPELKQHGGIESKKFIENICPVGSTALVDEDDKQTDGSYGRIIGVIYCNGVNLNERLLESDNGYLLTEFCSKSEFSDASWAQKHGCYKSQESKQAPKTENTEKCDLSYPDVCIPPLPPDLNCKDIPYKNFKVLPPDPHRFDGDKDGVGCES